MNHRPVPSSNAAPSPALAPPQPLPVQRRALFSARILPVLVWAATCGGTGLLLPTAASAQAGEARTAVGASRVQLEGQWFDGSATVAGRPLLLNGVGVRQVAWFKGFVAGLYLPVRAATADAAAQQPGPKRLQLRMLKDVPAGEFVKALNKGVGRNVPPQELQALEPGLRRLDDMIASLGKVRTGDVVDLDHEPGLGLVMRVNGTLRGDAVGGDVLFPAVLRAFVGERPYDERLKAGLLGRQP